MSGSPAPHRELKYKLKLRLAEVLDLSGGPQSQQRLDRATIHAQLRQLFSKSLEEQQRYGLTPQQQEQLIAEITNEVVGVGPLEPLLSDQTVSEILINGPSDVYIERAGKLERVPLTFDSTDQLMSVIERLLDTAGVSVTEAEPTIDASLPDGSRIHVVIPPLVLNGPTVTIRKKLRQFTVEDFIQLGSFSRAAAQFLEACVKAHVNIVVSGGTATGKTTLVGLLSSFIPSQERIITIETVPELELPDHQHWVRLITRQPNADGRGEVTLRSLVKNALRMHPNRIILGEARGGEALDVVQAMLTGHDGTLTVLHASSPSAALERLQTLMLMSGLDIPPEICRRQVASAVELLVHLSHAPDGSRLVEKIVQVVGVEGHGFAVEDLFVFHRRDAQRNGATSGGLEPTGTLPRFQQKFATYNIHLPEGLLAHA